MRRRSTFGSAAGIVAASLLAGSLSAGCSRQGAEQRGGNSPPADRQRVLGVSLLNLSSEFIVMLNQAIASKAAERNVRLIVSDAQRSAERQVQQVESFIAQGVDAVILNPCEVEASSPAVDKALAAGIDNSGQRQDPETSAAGRAAHPYGPGIQCCAAGVFQLQ